MQSCMPEKSERPTHRQTQTNTETDRHKDGTDNMIVPVINISKVVYFLNTCYTWMPNFDIPGV